MAQWNNETVVGYYYSKRDVPGSTAGSSCFSLLCYQEINKPLIKTQEK